MSRLKVRWVAGRFASFSRSASAVDGGGQTGESWWVMVVSRSPQAWSSSWAWCNSGRPVFLQKGTCSIIHGNVLFDMVVATQAFLTCYENHRRTKWHTLLWWVSVVCLGNGKECWSCWTLATCSHGCLNIYQPPKVLVFESEIVFPGQIGGVRIFFETHTELCCAWQHLKVSW